MSKYDDASWHNGAKNFPKHLPAVAGATHIGMFVAWALLSGLAGSIHVKDFPDDLQKLQKRSVTPGEFFYESCDGKFTNEDLNDEGNRYAQHYYDLEQGLYFKDYEAVLGGDVSDLYEVADTWANFDKLRPMLDHRFKQWRERHG
jgi:hypothetical protein